MGLAETAIGSDIHRPMTGARLPTTPTMDPQLIAKTHNAIFYTWLFASRFLHGMDEEPINEPLGARPIIST